MPRLFAWPLVLCAVACGRVNFEDRAIAAQEQIPSRCAPLPSRAGPQIDVSTVAELRAVLEIVTPGDTVRLADGTYDLSDGAVRISTEHVSLRGASGDRDAVVLDAGYGGGGVQIRASFVTVADLTVTRSSSGGSTSGIEASGGQVSHESALIYNVAVTDYGGSGVAIHGSVADTYSDNGTLACSRLAMSEEGRQNAPQGCGVAGVVATDFAGWRFADNVIEGNHCTDSPNANAMTLFSAARDAVIERNLFRDNTLGIHLGLRLDARGDERVDPLGRCPGTYVDFVGGVVRNDVFVQSSAVEPVLDVSVALWNACETQVVHNTVIIEPGVTPLASIEWRWQAPGVAVRNNLLTAPTRDREGATVTDEGNVRTENSAMVFAAGALGEFHLSPNSDNPAIATGVPLAAGVCDDDFDGDARVDPRDVGADQL